MIFYIKEFFPPILLRYGRRLIKRRYGWFGDYKTWDEALKDSSGYESEAILEKVKKSLLTVKNGKAAFERDSVIFAKHEYSFSLLSALLYVSSVQEGKLSVLDFGGSLGSTYFQYKNLFTKLKSLNWNIIEQEIFVKTGKEYFENHQLKFYYSMAEVDDPVDVLLLGCVLPYLRNPYEFLKSIDGNYKYLIVDRMPLIESNNDRLTVQKVDPQIYNASYPAWFFSHKKFLSFINDRYKIIFEYNCDEKINIDSCFKGFLLEKL